MGLTGCIIFWLCSIILGLIVYIAIASTIEKSGEKRLGVTGHLFTCTPDDEKKK